MFGFWGLFFACLFLISQVKGTQWTVCNTKLNHILMYLILNPFLQAQRLCMRMDNNFLIIEETNVPASLMDFGLNKYFS